MATFTSAAKLASTIYRAAEATGRAAERKRAIEAVGLMAKDVHNEESARAGLKVGSRLAGKPYKGYRYTVKDADTVELKPMGPAWLHNSDTRAHWIFPRGSRVTRTVAGPTLGGRFGGFAQETGRARRNAGKQSLDFNGGQNYANAYHDGTTGKNWSESAEKRVLDRAPEVYDRELGKTLGKVFK